MRNKNIFIDPPIQQARSFWLDSLHGMIHKFSAQKQLLVNRYQLSVGKTVRAPDFSEILGKISATQLSAAYRAINNTINKAEKYVKTWLSY